MSFLILFVVTGSRCLKGVVVLNIQTHMVSGWCLGNVVNLEARERLLCVVAASIADLDGISWFGGDESYFAYHHVLSHNLLAALIFSGVLAWFSIKRFKCFWLYFGIFHFHLFLDYRKADEGEYQTW